MADWMPIASRHVAPVGGAAAQTTALPAPSAQSQFLVSLVEAEGVGYGREDSFKMSGAGLLTQRFMLGIPLQTISPARLSYLCTALDMPPHCRVLLQRHQADANLIFFGLEENGTRSTYKVYLEFWESVKRKVLSSQSSAPLLLHLGFKWHAGGDGRDARVARYMCYPLLTVNAMLQRLQPMYATGGTPTAQDRVSHIIRRAASANPGASFIYIEASEEGNRRKSFDVNLYKAKLCVKDIHASLCDLAHHFGIPAQPLQSWLQHIRTCPLGHVSGGIDKDGWEFMTTYYETKALDG
jgi:hypothetical protein